MPEAREADLAVIELEDVYKTYRLYRNPRDRIVDQLGLANWLVNRTQRFSEFDALRGVSLRVRKGERLGIVGRNGAGKTTLLKLITGNFAPTRGRVSVRGSVQALMQVGLGFHPAFTGYENMRSALLYNGLSGVDLARAADDVVDFCELGEFLHQPTGTYSLGMRMRLQFATATAIRPEILIIDEIMGAGDAYFSAKSAHRMKRLTESGCTLLLVSHSPYQILEFCDEAIWLDNGAIRMEGDAHDVVGAYEVFIEQLTSAPDGFRPASGAPSEQAHGALLRSMLDDGRSVFRWPGKPGVKVSRIRLTDGVTDIDLTQPGGSVRLEMELGIERDGAYSCGYMVTLWNERMRRVARIEGIDQDFTAREGDRRPVVVDLTPFLLKRGSYYLSISIYDRSAGQQTGADTRFDVLMRCLSLKVADEAKTATPFYEHPAKWAFR